MGSFKEDLKRGQKVENLFVSLYLTNLPYGEEVQDISYCKNKEYDVAITSVVDGGPPIVQRYEIKCDSKSEITNNVAVEVLSRGKPSGLTSSTADWWVFYCYSHEKRHFRWVLLSKETLTNLIKKGGYTKVTGGDVGSGTEFYLLPVADLVRHCDTCCFED